MERVSLELDFVEFNVELLDVLRRRVQLVEHLATGASELGKSVATEIPESSAESRRILLDYFGGLPPDLGGVGRIWKFSGGFTEIWADYAESIADWGVSSGNAEKNFGGLPSAKFARPYLAMFVAALRLLCVADVARYRGHNTRDVSAQVEVETIT